MHNFQRPISRRRAQYASAKAANQAAYIILKRSVSVTPNTCKEIRDEMDILLSQDIRGAKVTRCVALKGRNGMVTAPPMVWP